MPNNHPFDAVRQQAIAACEQTILRALDEKKRTIDEAQSVYENVRDSAEDAFDRTVDAAWLEYERVIKQAWDEYTRKALVETGPVVSTFFNYTPKVPQE